MISFLEGVSLLLFLISFNSDGFTKFIFICLLIFGQFKSFLFTSISEFSSLNDILLFFSFLLSVLLLLFSSLFSSFFILCKVSSSTLLGCILPLLFSIESCAKLSLLLLVLFLFLSFIGSISNIFISIFNLLFLSLLSLLSLFSFFLLL